MSRIYNKPHLSLEDQLTLLKQRGLLVADDVAAIECLHRNGYYRLSAYWYPFREIVAGQRSDTFLTESSFDDALALYLFDKKFKLLLLDTIERVEIAARAEIALHLGARDPFAYANPQFFRPLFTTPDSAGNTKHQAWLQKFNEAVRRSKDEFVLHHNRKYGTGSPLPIWIAIELWDFGLLSRFYSAMDTADCVAVASRFAIPRWHVMKSWLRSLNYVRNVIAHHGRLWNLNLADSPSLPSRGLMPDFDDLTTQPNAHTRIYSICCILRHFSQVINPQSSWPQQLAGLIRDFPTIHYANIRDMGFPDDWEKSGSWK